MTEDFNMETFAQDMQAFEKRYPNVQLIMEIVEVNGVDKWRIEIDDKELIFDTYDQAIQYLNI